MWAVRLEEVSKRYPRGGASYGTFGSELSGFARRLVSRVRTGGPRLDGPLALDRLSLEIRAGEAFALIGPNGAGKSTALRMISRITYPTAGRVRVRGRVGALIEVGSGIHPELTGRENIWLYGTILGIKRAEIRRRFDSIVDFAELGKVMDMQVKYYSSGMQLRLGFSIAAHLEPEVFVVDEALSVGDAAFQSRAVARMRELLTAGATLVFVSHDLAAVEALCRRAAFIDLGRLMAEGDARDVLGAYLAAVEERRLTAGTPEPAGSIRLVRATCHGQGGDERYRFESGEAMELRLAFAGAPAAHPHVAIGVCDRNPDYPVIECSMLDDSSTVPARVADEWECRLFLQQLPLRPRTYEIWCEIFAEDGHGRLMSWTRAAMFRIENRARMGKRAVINAALAGAVAVEHSWDVRGQDAMRHEP